MEPREAAKKTVDGNRFGFANLVDDPIAYLQPVQEKENVYPSEVEGKKEPAARAGLNALEEAGVVERNHSGYDVLVDWDDQDYKEFVDELDFQKDYAL